ncbi:MAG: D-alanine--D-alanine ligase [Balneolaceae bacterium]
MHPQTLVIAFGGISPEHEVSVLTAMQAAAALKETQRQLIALYITKSGNWLTGDHLLELESYRDASALEKESVPCTFSRDAGGSSILLETGSSRFKKSRQWRIDAVLAAFHGSEGENGSFQGACDLFDIPCTGSGVFASAAGMDKVAAKRICREAGLPVVEGADFREKEWVENRDAILKQAESIGYPLVIKPVHLGSSIGVARASNREEFLKAAESAFRYDDHLMAERAVEPLMEVNCSVLGRPGDSRASVCERPVGAEELLSFRDKYESEKGRGKGMASAERIIPADIPGELSESIQQTSIDIFNTLSASGVARLDFLVHAESHEYWFNEINTIPGSFSFYLWEASGLPFRELLEELIDTALEIHRQKRGRVRHYETNLLSEKAVTGLKGLKGAKTGEKRATS